VTWDPDDPAAWRVADTINFAVHWWQHRLNYNRADDWIEEGRVDVQLAAILITYAHRQGLAVADLDTASGPGALRALAEAVATDKTLRRTLKNDLIHAAYGGKSTLLTGEWEGVRKASEHLLRTQPRRYDGAYKE